MKAHKARQTLETLIKMKARKEMKAHKARKKMRARKARKRMKERKAHKKRKALKKQQHEGTQTHKAREHVSHVGTRDT